VSIPRRGRLADIQAQQVEVGRIRLGTSTPKKSRAGKEYNEPVKLETFRLTSRSRDLVDEAAALYGGDCEPWTPQSGGAQQWQVLTERRSISVIVPPDPCSQFYEAWIGGKCQRRCDGVRELLADVPCLCGPDPSQRRCKPTTRLSLMLAEMSGIGVWRLETHGYYAAAELPAMADLLSAVGGNVPARLEMEERSAMVPDPRDSSKEVATRFMVPVLHVQRTPSQLVQILGGPVVPELNGPRLIPLEQLAEAAVADPQFAAGVAAIESSYDPEAELRRQRAVLFGQLEQQIAAATDIASLNAAANTIRQSGLPDEQVGTLRTIWQAHLTELKASIESAHLARNQTERTPQPPPAAPVDKAAEWMSIQSTAAALGLSVSALFTRFQEFSVGKTVQQATGEDLAAFHQSLRGGQ